MKKYAIILLILLYCSFSYSITTAFAIEDTSAPDIIEFSLTPNTVDVSTGPQNVTAILRITDLSGFNYGNLIIYNPSGVQVPLGLLMSSHRVSGDAYDGIYEVDITIAQYSAEGTYYVYRFSPTDLVGNTINYYESDLIDKGFETTFDVISGTEDTAAPDIVEFNFSPNLLDISTGPQNVTATLRVTDLAGFHYGYLIIRNPAGVQVPLGLINASDRISGDAYDGIYEIDIPIAQYSEMGTYYIERFSPYDLIGNSINYYESDLLSKGFQTTFDVTDDIDGDGFSYSEEIDCGSAPEDPSSRCLRFMPFLMLLLDDDKTNKDFTLNLPNTGQTNSYTTTFGEDSDYTINPPSYTLNDGGTTTDNVTGLMWQSNEGHVIYNWYEASGTQDDVYNPEGMIDVCDDLNLSGYNDWRLPNIHELQGIINYGMSNPAIDESYFPDTYFSGIPGEAGTESMMYFSSTIFADNSSYVWGGLFSTNGYIDIVGIGEGFVRCVRGNQVNPSFRDNGDGTVTDLITELTWQQQDDNTERIWLNTIRYCEELELPAGQSDWRLPNIKELSSIVDNTKTYPAINQTYFPNAKTYYWSSTTQEGGDGWGKWKIILDYGNTSVSGNTSSFYVRCVRGGQ